MLSNFLCVLTNVSNVKIRKQAFVARVNKKQNFVTDRPISNAGQGKYIKKVSFPCLLLETALSIFNFSFSLKNYFL